MTAYNNAVKALFISLNGYIFIVAIANSRILQTSLGYYFNPIVTVFLGMIFLKERLKKA